MVKEEHKYMEMDCEEEMELNPVLFLRGNAVPAGTTKLQIAAKLENVYGHKGAFRIYDFAHDSICVTVAKQAYKDGLDFGKNNNVIFYDAHNYSMWVTEQ